MFVKFRSRLTSVPLGAALHIAPNGAKSFLLFNPANILLLSEQRDISNEPQR